MMLERHRQLSEDLYREFDIARRCFPVIDVRHFQELFRRFDLALQYHPVIELRRADQVNDPRVKLLMDKLSATSASETGVGAA